MRLPRRRGRRPWGAPRRGAPRATGPPAKPPGALVRALRSRLVELVAILRELLVIAGRAWLRAAEVVGEIVLSAWDAAVLPPLELGLRGWRAAVRFGERQVTPARGLAVVALTATITLGASQFRDYRAIEIGAPSYSGVEAVAPAPERERHSPRSSHGMSVLAIAIAALFLVALAIAANGRLARLLIVLGVAVVLISLLVDARQGLREGLAATTYEGAKATLLGGFWIQLWSGVTLAISGPLLAVHLREERAARGARPAGEAGKAEGAQSARPASARGAGAEGAAT
jgi:hypothetical protein